jgi:hypothetical protein
MNNIKSKITTIVYSVYCMLIAYWISTNTGPVKSLSNIQTSTFGNSWVILNFIILFFFGYIVFLLIQGWIQNGRISILSQESQLQLFRDLPFQKLYRSAAVLLLTIIIGIIARGHAFAPDLGLVDLTQIESGIVSHDQYYAQVSGYPTNNEYLAQGNDNNPDVYIPLSSKKDGKHLTHLIVLVREKERAKYIENDYFSKKITVSGYISYAIDGRVKTTFEDRGIQLAPNVRSLIAKVNVKNRGTSKNFFFGIITGGISLSTYYFIRDNKS